MYVCAYESVYVGMLNMYAFLSSVLYVCLYMCGMYSKLYIVYGYGFTSSWLIVSFVATVVHPNPKGSTQYEGGRASGSSNNNGIFDDLIEMVLWLFTILQHASLKLFLCDDDSEWHHDAR